MANLPMPIQGCTYLQRDMREMRPIRAFTPAVYSKYNGQFFSNASQPPTEGPSTL